MSNNFKVYDSEKDVLNMNDRESQLISKLDQSPDIGIRFETIIAEFINSEENQKESVERLIEIFDFHFNAIRRGEPVLFRDRPNSLLRIIGIVGEAKKLIDEEDEELKTKNPESSMPKGFGDKSEEKKMNDMGFNVREYFIRKIILKEAYQKCKEPQYLTEANLPESPTEIKKIYSEYVYKRMFSEYKLNSNWHTEEHDIFDKIIPTLKEFPKAVDVIVEKVTGYTPKSHR